MSETDSRRVPEDEIDLGRVGRQLASVAGYPFRLFGRHPFIVITFLVTGALAAIATKYAIAPKYRASFILRPADKQERFHLQLLADLEVVKRQGDYTTLSRMLETGEAMARTLQHIETENPFLEGRRDSINYTIITLVASKPESLVALQNGVKAYLENSPYFSMISRLQQAQVKVQKEMVERDILLLDSLKSKVAAKPASSPVTSQFVLSDLTDPTRAFVMANERMAKKVALMAQEVFNENFMLIKPVVIPLHHSFPPRILIAAMYLLPVSIVCCFIFLVLFENVGGNRLRQRS